MGGGIARPTVWYPSLTSRTIWETWLFLARYLDRVWNYDVLKLRQKFELYMGPDLVAVT